MFSEEMYELGMKRSVIRELFEYGKQRANIVGKENIFDFSIGNPTVPAPDCIEESIIELLKTKDTSYIHGYTSAQGDMELRQRLADYLNETYQAGVKADNFYITCGAAASLCITFKALTESNEDEFITIAPFFPEYRLFVKAAGAKFKIVKPDTESFQINISALEETVNEHTKGIIVNSPNNPSGVIYTKDTILKLCEVLNRKSKEYGHPIFLISDEPYREIAFDNIEVPYLTNYYENTIVCYSYSKSLSLPGERIGYILVPPKVSKSESIYAAVMGAGRSLGYVCAPSLFQKVVCKCIGQTSDMEVYKENRDLLYQSLSDMGYQCVYPDGAFYLFVKTLEEDSIAFCENAKKYDLLIVPGDDFGCPGYARISYCVDKDMLKRSFTAFQKLIQTYSE